MRKPSILSIAMCCGVAAFCWTLVRRAPEFEPPPDARVAGQTRMAAGGLAFGGVQSLEFWEQRVTEDQDDAWAWLNLAQRRQWKDRDDAREAWEHAFKKGLETAAESRRYGRARFAAGMAGRALGLEAVTAKAFEECRLWYEQRVKDGGLSGGRGGGGWLTLGWACKHLGDHEAAHKAWLSGAQAVAPSAQTDAGAAYDLACFWALTGEPGDALRLLDHAATLGFSDVEKALHDESLESIRADKAFPSIVRKMRARPRGGVRVPNF